MQLPFLELHDSGFNKQHLNPQEDTQLFTTSLARKVQGVCSEVMTGEGQHE